MDKSQKERAEIEFAKRIKGEIVPHFEVAGGTYKWKINGLGISWGVKDRKNGFKMLNSWLDEDNEALALKGHKKEWLVCMKLSTLQELLKIK
ncbi:hypothetical protein SAMN05444392_11176 [Seinonella peptonophila]|uniref:Uncharacterized protein n=1 Tax=Seinonella peptonophila TaxID=112248 RepID=A0A1M5A156_9BACL|nr:hypothetical protein [Seinonella peptonophila]SHF23636.1 hypothetical protein SAMN05444392_11176 [Seinonella peptonophila]